MSEDNQEPTPLLTSFDTTTPLCRGMARGVRRLLVVAVSTTLIWWCLGFAGCLVDGWRDRRVRAELHLLNLIRVGLMQHFWQGGECPTNWLMLSNAIDSKAVTECARYNRLGDPSERYTVLGTPVRHHEAGTTGLVFVVRSEPHNGVYWTLAMVDYGGLPSVRGGTNTEVRRWHFKRNELPPQIRDQLKAQRKR